MRYTINHWYGRLGNNIQQISNAIYYCRLNGFNFHSPPHSLIEEFSENFGVESDLSSTFYSYSEGGEDVDYDVNDLNSQRKSICETFILPRLKIPLLKKPLPSSTLVVHLRGGDIFNRNPAYQSIPGGYVQNPLCFYEGLFKKFKSILVVAEDLSNPLIEPLQKKQKVKIICSSIEEDFSLLLRAKNLAPSGVGTFAIAAALCSKNIENLFCTNLFWDSHLNPLMLKSKINVEINKLSGYIQMGEWKNTQAQKALMLKYKCQYSQLEDNQT
tara:strand:+ start:6751 stop:7563 length:813 start_codon:yes stop_codon:yes gene_type:complete